MDQRELPLQPLGICYRIYHFIVKILTSQAFKKVTLGRPMHVGSTQARTNSSAGSEEREVVVQPETKEQAEEEKKNPCMNINGEEEVAPREKAPKKMVSINENVEEINSSKKKKKRSKSFQKSNSLEQQQQQQQEEIKPPRSILKVKSNLDEKSLPECSFRS